MGGGERAPHIPKSTRRSARRNTAKCPELMDTKQLHAATRTDSISAKANCHRRANEGLQRLYPEPVETCQCTSHSILILCLASRNGLFPSGDQDAELPLFPVRATCPDNPIPSRYLLSRTNHEAPHYVTLSSFRTLYSDTLSLCSPLNETEDFPCVKVKGFELSS